MRHPFFNFMKITYHSSIIRFEGSYPSLSAFLLTPMPEESDKESMQLSAEGKFFVAPDSFSASYQEEDGTNVRLSLEKGTLSFSRGATHAVFPSSGSASFLHRTEYGALTVDTYTLRLELQEKNGSFLLTLTYLAYIGGMVQKNMMKWKFTH